MKKPMLVTGDVFRELKRAPSGAKVQGTVINTQFPGKYDVTSGGGVKPISCYVRLVDENVRGSKKSRVFLEKQ